MISIPISELNGLNVVSSSDYIAIVKDSTTTTFKTPLTSLGNWISSSVESSSSFSSISASYSLSSSWANNSRNSLTSSNLIYPNNSTASYAITSSNAITASFALRIDESGVSVSASWASASIRSITSSYASSSISSSYATTASWAPVPISASWASSSIFSTSSSFASRSISSSYAGTSSYVVNYTNPVKAFGTFYMTGSGGAGASAEGNFIPFSGSSNFISASYRGQVYQSSNLPNGMDTSSLSYIRYNTVMAGFGTARTWIFHMSTPMPSKNYTVLASNAGEQGIEWFELINYPLSSRTTTAFSMSAYGSANFDTRYPNNNTEINWVSLMVLHP